MRKVFLDTDVAFDIISGREPHYATSVQLIRFAFNEKIRLMIAECSIEPFLS